jgi:hypothetical protein
MVAQIALPKLDEVAVISEFIDPAEHTVLLRWAEKQFAKGRLKANPAGPNRYFARYDEGGSVPPVFWKIRKRAISAFSVAEYEDEPEFKCFLGCNTEGGFVQPHRDPTLPGRHHVRLNIMLSKPWRGGYPVVDGRTVEVAERDLWCFYPSAMLHYSTPAMGSRKRFVISIGILVPESAISRGSGSLAGGLPSK